MDDFTAIEELKKMLDMMGACHWSEPIRIALEALKARAGYCEECQIRYEDDGK